VKNILPIISTTVIRFASASPPSWPSKVEDKTMLALPHVSNSAFRTDLQSKVRRAERRHFLKMLALMAPSVIFVAFFFLLPTALFMFKSVDNSEIPALLPKTVATVAQWEEGELPPEKSYRALVQDLSALKGTSDAALLARRLNYITPGYRSLITNTIRKLHGDVSGGSAKELLANIDQRWLERRFWATIKQQSGPLTDFFLLSAIELQRDAYGLLVSVPDDYAIFFDLYWRTFYVSIGVTLICLLIGYPVAQVMASAKPKNASKILMLVLVPFWTSTLVRTTAWIILLQNEGLVNKSLLWLGITSEPIQLVFNIIGVFIAMVHVMLPYMILPLYSVLKNITPEYLKAASSLGATPFTVFRTVYLPLSMPGIAAGCTLVFVICVGFYVTPALVGGAGDQMIGYFIAYFTNQSVNWGLASALGTLLLILIGIIYLVLGRLVGFDKIKVR
jgi:putative spermidine/putrescine transport system permease protein